MVHSDTTELVELPDGDVGVRCAWCERVRPLKMYGRDSSRPSGIAAYCRYCTHKRGLEERRFDRMGVKAPKGHKRDFGNYMVCPRCEKKKHRYSFDLDDGGRMRICWSCWQQPVTKDTRSTNAQETTPPSSAVIVHDEEPKGVVADPTISPTAVFREGDLVWHAYFHLGLVLEAESPKQDGADYECTIMFTVGGGPKRIHPRFADRNMRLLGHLSSVEVRSIRSEIAEVSLLADRKLRLWNKGYSHDDIYTDFRRYTALPDHVCTFIETPAFLSGEIFDAIAARVNVELERILEVKPEDWPPDSLTRLRFWLSQASDLMACWDFYESPRRYDVGNAAVEYERRHWWERTFADIRKRAEKLLAEAREAQAKQGAASDA